MTRKKDLYDLHCRVKPITAQKLKLFSDDTGYSVGEVIDEIVDGYEGFANSQDEWLEKAEIHETLQRLINKIDRVAQKIGINETAD